MARRPRRRAPPPPFPMWPPRQRARGPTGAGVRTAVDAERRAPVLTPVRHGGQGSASLIDERARLIAHSDGPASTPLAAAAALPDVAATLARSEPTGAWITDGRQGRIISYATM